MALGLRQLKYFVTVADAGALSHAARILNVAASALSHHVGQIEGELGVTLFERRSRGVVLTAAGERLYQHAKSILASVRASEEDVRSFSEEVTGTLSIGLTHTAVDHAAVPLLTTVREKFPRLALSVVEGLSAMLVNRVLSGEIDLAIVYNPVHDPRLERAALLEEELCLVGIADVVGSEGSAIRFEEMPRQPIIAPHPNSTLRAIIESHIIRSRIDDRGLLQLDSLVAMRAALIAGLGYTLLPRASVARELEAGSLVARSIVEPSIHRQLCQVWLGTRARTRAFTEVGQVLTGVIERCALSGHWPARWL